MALKDQVECYEVVDSEINEVFVYVIARAGVNFGINCTSCSENGNLPSSLQRVEFIPKFHFW